MKKTKSSNPRRSKKPSPVRPPAKRKGGPIGNEITQSAAFQKAASKAESYLGEPGKLRKLCEEAIEKINEIPRGPFADTWPYLMAMIRLIRAYHREEYRDMSRQNLLIVVAAIIYFVSPFDVIPDWVPVLGHIDDAFVVALALRSARADLDTFMAWETSKV